MSATGRNRPSGGGSLPSEQVARAGRLPRGSMEPVRRPPARDVHNAEGDGRTASPLARRIRIVIRQATFRLSTPAGAGVCGHVHGHWS